MPAHPIKLYAGVVAATVAVLLLAGGDSLGADAFGIVPTSYKEGEYIPVKVNGLSSTTQVVPMPWYSLPWCQLPGHGSTPVVAEAAEDTNAEDDSEKPIVQDASKIKSRRKNLGENLQGHEVLPSLFGFEVGVNVTCRRLCSPIALGPKDKALMARRVEEHYRGQLLLDDLPVGEEGSGQRGHYTTVMATGFPIGLSRMRKFKKSASTTTTATTTTEPPQIADEILNQFGGEALDQVTEESGTSYSSIHRDPKKSYINNHLAFSIYITETTTLRKQHNSEEGADANPSYHIVGFQVTPMSVGYGAQGNTHRCINSEHFVIPDSLQATEDDTVEYTYSVAWHVRPDLKWSTRWDVYLKGSKYENRIHWFAIFNSIVIIAVLTSAIGSVLYRALRKDLSKCNDPESIQEDRDDSGWKLIHGDVFRKPEHYSSLLAVLVGSGVQLIFMVGTTLVFAALGFLAPHNRGALLTTLILLYVLVGFTNGYFTAQLLKYFKSRSWNLIFTTAVFFPGQMFAAYLLLNFVHWGKGSTSAAPFTSILMLIALWACVSLPLVLIGGGVGFRSADIFTSPRKVSSIPRTIPPQPWYLRRPVAFLIAGFIPFGTAFVESIFVLTSVWQGRVYYFFGFFSVTFVMVLLTAAEATIMLIYLQLVHLDYRWWWSSFMAAGYHGVWLFMYSILYYFLALDVTGWWSTVLYFAYMTMASYFCFVLVGTCGFLATYVFVRVIYSSIMVV